MHMQPWSWYGHLACGAAVESMHKHAVYNTSKDRGSRHFHQLDIGTQTFHDAWYWSPFTRMICACLKLVVTVCKEDICMLDIGTKTLHVVRKPPLHRVARNCNLWHWCLRCKSGALVPSQLTVVSLKAFMVFMPALQIGWPSSKSGVLVLFRLMVVFAKAWNGYVKYFWPDLDQDLTWLIEPLIWCGILLLSGTFGRAGVTHIG